MTLSEKGLNFIKRHEGFRSRPYLDAVGIPTIGYGCTFYPDGRKVTMADKPITEAEATTLLRALVAKFGVVMRRLIKVPLTQNQWDALVSLCMAIGTGNFQRSSVLSLVNKNPNDDAIYDAFLKHSSTKKGYMQGLANRRHDEATLYGVKKKP